jgi:hypothetical protein
MTKCPYCGKEIPAEEFAEHHAKCEKRSSVRVETLPPIPPLKPPEEKVIPKLKIPVEDAVEKEKEELSTLSEDLKRNIRESLVYALKTSIPKKESWMRELVVEEFYSSLNRKNILLNYEAEEEIKKAKEQLEQSV